MAIFGKRSAGVLMHVTSLPGKYGMGDIGDASNAWIEHLADHQQTWWQFLPISPIGDGFSPYSSDSAFAGEPCLLGPGQLFRDGFFTSRDLRQASLRESTKVPFAKTIRIRRKLLSKAFASERGRRTLKSAGFAKFAKDEAYWLRDFCLFRALAKQHKTSDWTRWDEVYRRRDRRELNRFAAGNVDMQQTAFEQYLFRKHWEAMRRYAKSHGVYLLGDLPIFVSHASADCWAHAEEFQLTSRGNPRVVSGCPPDAFAKTGQLWGHALYDWSAMRGRKFKWWLERFAISLERFDAIRLDHFIGFYRYWSVPAGEKTAKNGSWRRSQGDELFQAARRRFGPLPFVAEDLGPVVPPVRELRDKHLFAAMKLLQFGFAGDKEAREHCPHHFGINSVVYPGTHDNDTAIGWYKSLQKASHGNTKAAKSARVCLDNLKGYFVEPTAASIPWDLAKTAHQSPAHTAVIPAQDILSLGRTARMNVPGTAKGNWTWRMQTADYNDLGWDKLAELTLATERSR